MFIFITGLLLCIYAKTLFSVLFYFFSDFLDQFTKEYTDFSWLDVNDVSPSEILADAGLVPAISPVQSIKSSPNESSNSDSGSEDDFKM